ncbi:50S ribosome-binding GTPase [Candidatus Woesearchaeota archaeon]|nr:50S ribosome-binding GTPase [Candidatus Woesearchaeota archaeon]
MADPAARIKELEAELKKTQYNKATEHHFGVVKAQIAKLRDKIELQASKKTAGQGFGVKKSGDATVVLLGFPSVGKSTLLNAITKAESKIGAYEFTTLDVVPGLLEHNFAKIQILDIPGIIAGAAAGKGRGREILSMVRNADLLLILIDAKHPEHYQTILKEVHDANVRVNQQKPIVKIKKKAKGGISIGSTVKLKIARKTMQDILKELKFNNADVVIRSKIDIDSFIDAIEGNRTYTSALTVITKIDMVSEAKRKKLIKDIKPDLVVSAEKGEGISELKDAIFNKLNLMRLFMKEVGKNPDLEEPMIVRRGITIAGVCNKIHRDFVKKFKYAKIWGKSAKFPGQIFHRLEKKLEDGDIIEIHIT